MKVLVVGEFSGRVRDAFKAQGHKVLSCDFLPTDQPGPHYQGNYKDVIFYPWDMALFFLDCTHTAVSGAKHFEEKWNDGRQAFGVSAILEANHLSKHIPRTVFENPVSILSTLWRKPDQIIQPWQYGHGETKATCLWLKGVDLLKPTNIVEGREDRIHKMPPSADRAKKRSEMYSGIAEAMGQQWGKQEIAA